MIVLAKLVCASDAFFGSRSIGTWLVINLSRSEEGTRATSKVRGGAVFRYGVGYTGENLILMRYEILGGFLHSC